MGGIGVCLQTLRFPGVKVHLPTFPDFWSEALQGAKERTDVSM